MDFEKRKKFGRIWEICVVLCVFVLVYIVVLFSYFRFKALFRLSKAFLVHLWYSCSFLSRKCLIWLKNGQIFNWCMFLALDVCFYYVWICTYCGLWFSFIYFFFMLLLSFLFSFIVFLSYSKIFVNLHIQT